MTPCMDVYEANIQSDGSIETLKLRILFRGDLQDKEIIGYTWAPTLSMGKLKYFSADSTKYKARVHQLDFIGSFLQANVKHRVFVKLDCRYGEYFPDCANYFGRQLRLNKSMYGMINSGNLFSDELTNWLIDEAGFNHSKCKISLYYKYTPYGSKLVVLSYVDDCLYWCTYEELGKLEISSMWTS